MACSWGNNHEQLNNFPLFSQAPQLGDVFHLGSAPVHHQHQLDNARLRFKLSKRFFQQVGEQLWAAAEGEEEMCLIDGERYESRAQRNTLSTFFGPIGFWALSPMEKGSPLPRKWTKKSEKFCGILGMCSDRFWVLMGSVDLFSWWKIDSPKFFPSQEGRHLSLLSWGTN